MKTKEIKEKTSLREKLSNIPNAGVIGIMLVFIIVVVASTGSKFFTVDNITNLLRSVSIVGIMASAVTLIMITGNIDLSLGWMIGFTACITGANSSNFGTAILLALAAGIACGALNGFLVGVLRLNAFITTLGTMYIFKGIAMMYANNRLVTAANGSKILQYIGQGYLLKVPLPVWIFLVVALIFGFLLARTNFGSKIYYVGANFVSAKFSGINSSLVIALTYILAGLATGLAGTVFYAKVMSVQAYSGVGLEFDVLTAIVLGGTSVTGGKGSVAGTVLGVVFVGILGNGFTLMGLGANAQYITQGLILLIAMRADVMRSRGLRA
ncbi:MAG: ABC transporter permease [Oscillospiraceae bacterium]|jgi:ribose/xylose/arabinose/galactoside ABC-type transport system permease subunit